MTNDIAQGPVDVSVGQVAENERFSPSVVIDGRTVTPAGWMWVLGFALGGCEWAVIEASKPEFRAQVAEWMRERKRVEAEHEIADMERRIANIRQSLPPNAGG